jgi:hypothetical protein
MHRCIDLTSLRRSPDCNAPHPWLRRRRRPWNYVGKLPLKTTLKRLKGKERLTNYEWLCDWHSSLRLLGYVRKDETISSMRSRTDRAGMRKKECLCMVKDKEAVFLYSSIKALQKGNQAGVGQFSTIYRIVRGNRPNAVLGAKRLENRSAVKIIPKVDLQGRPLFFVDFDGDLFEPGAGGIWRITAEMFTAGLYAAYRENSNHFRKYRPYQKGDDSKILSDTVFDSKLGFAGSSRNELINNHMGGLMV